MIVLYILRDAFHGLFCVFGDFYASGMQDTEVKKSLTLSLVGRKVKLLGLPVIVVPVVWQFSCFCGKKW